MARSRRSAVTPRAGAVNVPLVTPGCYQRDIHARSRRPLRHGRAGPALAGLALAGLAVAGCGAATAGTNGSGAAASTSRPGSGTGASGQNGSGQDTSGRSLPAGSALCARPGQASRVVIARTAGVRILEGQPGTQPNGTLPPVTGSRPVQIRIITRPDEVHGLARALCGLPKMPSRPLPCPAQFPGSYQLYFTARGLRLAVVVVEESGCREVTGLGPVRRADQPAFWQLLGRIVGGNPLTPLPGSPGSVQPGGPNQPGSGLLTGCEPIVGQPPRACPYHSGLPHKPWG
jgi:hypothetical protein